MFDLAVMLQVDVRHRVKNRCESEPTDLVRMKAGKLNESRRKSVMSDRQWQEAVLIKHRFP